MYYFLIANISCHKNYRQFVKEIEKNLDNNNILRSLCINWSKFPYKIKNKLLTGVFTVRFSLL